MIQAQLIPEKTGITAKGESQPLDISAAQNRVFLATLTITAIVEQESIDVAFYSSADGQTWSAKPVMTIPQRFYCGETPALVDLRSDAAAKFLRANWEVNRWGRGSETPNFEVSLSLREVPDEMLREAGPETTQTK